MPANQFKPFATGGGANVLSQAAWEALAALATGFSAGTAASAQVNKAIRQGNFGTAVLMQYIAETLNSDSLDNGDLAAHVIRLRDALSAGATNPSGVTSLRKALAFNNVGAPNTQVDFSAQLAMLTDSAGKLTRLSGIGPITCDATLAGPIANGRDQAAAFGNNTFIHLYLILKPSTSTKAQWALSCRRIAASKPATARVRPQ